MRRSLGLPTGRCRLPIAWRVGQITVSSPEVLKPLAKLNAGKPYAQQIKPFNFILSCHVAPFGHPVGADPERFHLIAPYETDPRKWFALPWIDQYSGKQYRISATLPTGTRQIARVKSYGDVLKSTSSTKRRSAPMRAARRATSKPWGCSAAARDDRGAARFIGKESNKLEEVEEGPSPMPATFTPSIPMRGATSGRRRYCPNCAALTFRSLRLQATSTEGRFSESALENALI